MKKVKEVVFKVPDFQDKEVLDRIQKSVPLSKAPFTELASEFGLREEDLMERLKVLKGSGVIRQISGIFDAASLGYQTALVAMKIPPPRLEEVVSLLNRHPGVSHNYLRDHPFNLWFTLSVLPNGVGIMDHLETLSDAVSSEVTLYLPALRLYKIGVKFQVGAVHSHSSDSGAEEFYHEGSRPLRPLMPWEQKIVLALQDDLPLVGRPFLEKAGEFGLSEEVLLEAGRRLQREGFLRRFSAVLRHQKIGFTSNIMTVWEVPETRIDEVAQKFARCPFVSHCYRRPTCPDWPYNLFAMIHGRSPEECQAQVEKMNSEAKADRSALLKTLREFKKIRTRYFTSDQEEWERKYLRTNQAITAMRASGRSDIRTVLPM